MIRNMLPKTTDELVRWYERYISPLALVGGFIADNLILLRRVDAWTTNALLGAYLVIAAFGIILMHAATAGRIRGRFVLAIMPFIPVAVQFSFGGLFSGFLSLYSRSASTGFSWIFVVVVGALLLGNERFIRFYRRFPFQVGVYYMTLFGFLIFFLPIVTHRIGPAMFLAAGGGALIIIALLQWLLSRVARDIPRGEWKVAGRSVVGITLVFVALYFTNAIPPLPLALRDAGVYHSITRTTDGYAASGESYPWYVRLISRETYHQVAGESVYIYTAIFAPSGLSLTITHQWQLYDATSSQWTTVSEVAFPINGGRELGYRGYSYKFDPAPGEWRVNVITDYGQIIGRVPFTVVEASTTPMLVERTL